MKKTTFAGLADRLEAGMARFKVAQPMALLEGGVVIQTAAKEMFGTYQPEKPPFPEWAPLTEQTQEERARLGFPPNEPLLRTGALRDSIEVAGEDDAVHVGVSGDMATIAAAQEFGTARIPPRPFLRPSAQETLPEAGRIIASALRRALLED